MHQSDDHPSTRPPSAPVDFEALLGGRGFQAVGLISLFLSAAFFFKLAVDHNWISPLVRVVIGLAAGTALLGWSIAMRGRPNVNGAILDGLTGLGGSLCYLSIWAAGPLFHIIDSTVALEAMSVVTATLAFLAARYRSRATAIYGVIGGLLTPGVLPLAGQHVLLAAYLLALCAGMLRLAADRRFTIIPALAFIGTLIYAARFAADPATGWTALDALILATLFYGQFALDHALAARRCNVLELSDRAFTAVNIGVYLALLELDLQQQSGLLSIILVGLSIAFAAVGIKMRSNAVMNATYLWAAAGAFTLAIPAYLSTHLGLMCAAFVVEGAALYIFGLLAVRKDFYSAGAGLAFVTAPLGCMAAAGTRPTTAGYVEAFLTYAAIALTLFAMAAIRRGGERRIELAVEIAGVAGLLANGAVAVTIADAIFALPIAMLPTSSEQQLWLSVAWTIQAVVIFGVALWRCSPVLRSQSLALLVVTVAKVVAFDLASIELIDRVVVCFGLGVVTLVVSAFYLRRLHGSAPPDELGRAGETQRSG